LNEVNYTEMLNIKSENGLFVVNFRHPSIGGIGEVEQIAQVLRGLIPKHQMCNMIIDFSDVSFFSSQMLGLLVDIWQRVKAGGGRLLICGINPQLTRVFRITHLDKLFDFYETTEAAVAALQIA